MLLPVLLCSNQTPFAERPDPFGGTSFSSCQLKHFLKNVFCFTAESCIWMVFKEFEMVGLKLCSKHFRIGE